MNKTLLSTTLLVLIAATAFVPTAQAASTGAITISGKVVADTCTVLVNNGADVVLPTVTTSDFAAVNATAGDTPFTVALSGCDTSTPKATMAFSGSNIDALTGNLKNTVVGGSDVQVQLLNGATVVNTSNNTNAPVISLTSGAGSASMSARYIATNNPTSAGLVASTVNFTLTYQ